MNKGNPQDDHEIRLAGLYEEYYDKIARYVYVRIGNREEAEDIAGEVFLNAFKALDSYQERGIPMQGWLFRNLGNPYPDLDRFTIVIWVENRDNFAQAPEDYYFGKNICVTGLITEYEGVPEIEIRYPSGIQDP